MEQHSDPAPDCRVKVGRRHVLQLSGAQVGARLAIDHQVYTLIGTSEFRRKDGSTALLYSWRAPCATCGREFITTSAPSGCLPTRRCREHRNRTVAVRAEGKFMRAHVRWLLPEEQAGAATTTTGPFGA